MLRIKYDIPPERVWNWDQTGLHNLMLSDKTYAPMGQGQFLNPTSSNARERYTLTVAINGAGRVGYPTITFKENKGQFGKYVLRDLQKHPNAQFVWLQPSSSGMQDGPCVDDMVEHCWPCPKEKSIWILDSFNSWASEENAQWIHQKGNVLVVRIPENMTAAIQPLDRFFFKPYKKLERECCLERLKEQAAKMKPGVPTPFKPRYREDIIDDCVRNLNTMQLRYRGDIAAEFKRIGYTTCWDGTEDKLLHSDLTGERAKVVHYKSTVAVPQTAAERLSMVLRPGPKEFVKGTNNVYFLSEEEVEQKEQEEVVLNQEWLQALRQSVEEECGAERIQAASIQQTAEELPTQCPEEWTQNGISFVPSADSFFS